MPAKVFITINDSRWNEYKIDFAKIANLAMHNALSLWNYRDREISIVLTNDEEIRKLNKKYRGIDKPTNVLSFETGDSELMGDIFISFDTTMREAQAEKKRFIDHAAHLIMHGVLHLLGHDHISDSDADKMETLEARILAKLSIKNPYEAESKTKRFIPCLLCFVFGAIASFGFAPFYLWPLTFIGIGAAYRLIFNKNGKNSFILPFGFGAGYAAASFWWVLHSIYVVPELASQFAIWTVPGIIGLALAGGLIFGAPFWLTSYAVRFRPAASRPVVFAAAWTFVLWLREWLLTGFPWNPIANIAMPFPALANSMSLFGALGLTFVLIGLIASTAELFAKREARGRGRFVPFLIFIPLLLVGIVYGYYNITITNRSPLATRRSPLIRIVQPAEAQSFKMSRESADESVGRLVNLSKNAPGEPDIIIWPETAYPYLVVGGEFPPARELKRIVIAGAMSMDEKDYFGGRPGRLKNSMVVAGPDGKITNIYSKSHLVPFGEYRPFGDIVPTPGQLARGRGPETIGIRNKEPGIDFLFAPAICYEIIFSDSLLPLENIGIEAVVNITNDTWFGKTPGTYQHLDMARRQAVETGLPVVRANYSGISAFISADGRVVSSLPVGAVGTVDGRLSGAHITPYRRIGRDRMIIIILGFAAAATLLTRRKAR